MEYHELIKKYNSLLEQVDQLTRENRRLKAKVGLQEPQALRNTTQAIQMECVPDGEINDVKPLTDLCRASDSFSNLADQFCQVKKQVLKLRSFNNIKNYMNRAKIAWGHANIKAIGYAEIEDFLYSQDVSNKTRSNMRSCLHNFWFWLRRRRTITQQEFPEFPEISYELGWRKIVDQKTQKLIIDEVYRISKEVNIKIWIGIKWLSVYIGMRPGEMLNLKEENIDLGIGALIIPHPKEKRPKLIYCLKRI